VAHYYWNDWYMGWGWFLWYGIILLFFLNVGNWGYTYRAHRKFEDGYPDRDALDILNARYARGDINDDEYLKIKSHISREDRKSHSAIGEEKSPKKPSHPNSSPLQPMY